MNLDLVFWLILSLLALVLWTGAMIVTFIMGPMPQSISTLDICLLEMAIRGHYEEPKE